MRSIVHTLLHETQQGAFVSDAYDDRDRAVSAARNAAEAHAVRLCAAEAAFLRQPVAATTYRLVVTDYRASAVVSVVDTPTGETDSAHRWTVQEHEVVGVPPIDLDGASPVALHETFYLAMHP